MTTITRRKLIQLVALGKAIGHLRAKDEQINVFFNISDLEELAWEIINSLDSTRRKK